MNIEQKTFKNNKTGEIIKLEKTDCKNWGWRCSHQESMRTFLELAGKGVEKGLKKNWKEIKGE